MSRLRARLQRAALGAEHARLVAGALREAPEEALVIAPPGRRPIRGG